MMRKFVKYYLQFLFEFYLDEFNELKVNRDNHRTESHTCINDKQTFVQQINEISLQIGIDVKLVFINRDFGQFDRGIPLACDILSPENKDKFVIGVSHFGLSNLDITLVETVFLIVQEKLLKDMRISFEKSFLENDNEFYPFLVIASVFFGFSDLLLFRSSIRGTYINEFGTKYEYTYRIPIQEEPFIYSVAMVEQFNEISYQEVKRHLIDLNKRILKKVLRYKKELEKCSYSIEKLKLEVEH